MTSIDEKYDRLKEDDSMIGIPNPLRGGREPFPTPRFKDKKYAERLEPIPKERSKCMTCINHFEIEESAFLQTACREGLLDPFDKQDSWRTMKCPQYQETLESKEKRAALKKKRLLQDAGVTIFLGGDEEED